MGNQGGFQQTRKKVKTFCGFSIKPTKQVKLFAEGSFQQPLDADPPFPNQRPWRVLRQSSALCWARITPGWGGCGRKLRTDFLWTSQGGDLKPSYPALKLLAVYIYIYTHTYTNICIYIYVCVDVSFVSGKPFWILKANQGNQNESSRETKQETASSDMGNPEFG